jgi:hypothetical protein
MREADRGEHIAVAFHGHRFGREQLGHQAAHGSLRERPVPRPLDLDPF